MSWLPGGNFIANALAVVNNPAVNFWLALWNSIFSSPSSRPSVVVFSTLAGWAFAKLRFRGGKGLLAFVVATMAVPMQLGVVPLYILFSDLGWTGQIGAIIVPALTSAFGVFWMTQYLQPDRARRAHRGGTRGRRIHDPHLLDGRASSPRARPRRCCSCSRSSAPGTSSSGRSSCSTGRTRRCPVALSLLQSNYFVDYSIVLAGVLLATIPLLILFVFAGKQLVSGIMAGAVKG